MYPKPNTPTPFTQHQHQQVTDASGSSLASHCPSLAVVKLTKAMTDSTLRQLATNCANLQEVDMHRCVSVL